MAELTVEAKVGNIERVTEFVNDELAVIACPARIRVQIDVAIDELFSNIAQYAYGPQGGPATVRVEVLEEPPAVVVTFVDHGVPFDPLARRDPDMTLPLDQRGVGGLGIFMVKRTMDDVQYEYRDGSNILRILKHLP